MIIVFIKKDRFFKNVDPYGNIFDVRNEDTYIEEKYTKVELPDIYKDCVFEDFNEDLTFSFEKYNARKNKENKLKYKREIERRISLKYDIYDELAIRRQKEDKPLEYQEYYDYVEQCKAEVKQMLSTTMS